MLTIDEAFRKFKSNCLPTDQQDKDAARRQKEVRAVMDGGFNIANDFLTGSYKRWTKTRPLKDVDIFCVLHDEERAAYRTGKHPSVVLEAARKVLAAKYGDANVHKQRRSVQVNFDDGDDDHELVMSFDVVPAFTKSSHYEIPDTATTSGWTETNPKVHEEKATAANKAFDGEWVGMVRMAKSWNRYKGKPVKPSFLIEVMALELLRPPFNGDFPFEFQHFFASMADRINDTWPDPAGLGPAVSDSMSQAERNTARQALTDAQHAIREAIQLSRAGKNGDALRKYRDDVFGPYFPLS